ncbi:MAG: response regulator [Bdellovibrionia bacterium]
MVIEDDESIRQTIALALEIKGYQVISVSDGQEAIHILSKSERPCLILLDLMMPVLDGWAFLDELKKMPREIAEIPIIVVSAFNDRSGKLDQDGEFIPKPIDLEQLFYVAQKYCSERRAA